ncbi:hypothetical protein EII17_08850 [Clostridiales bacterium COT073_COT-073]|nr:hypothetical protein EII17_08850 [Clostridiales bacterium COT073_COT-073]
MLTLDEFFRDNVVEDSIAPNQWLYGRPSILDIWGMLNELEKSNKIAWVRVSLHDDTEIEVDDNGEEELFLLGDTIVICTSMNEDELQDNINTQWLCADGVIPAEMEGYSNIPQIPEQCSCYEIVWD